MVMFYCIVILIFEIICICYLIANISLSRSILYPKPSRPLTDEECFLLLYRGSGSVNDLRDALIRYSRGDKEIENRLLKYFKVKEENE